MWELVEPKKKEMKSTLISCGQERFEFADGFFASGPNSINSTRILLFSKLNHVPSDVPKVSGSAIFLLGGKETSLILCKRFFKIREGYLDTPIYGWLIFMVFM